MSHKISGHLTPMTPLGVHPQCVLKMKSEADWSNSSQCDVDTLRITGCSESYQNVALPCQRLQRYHFTFKMKVLIPQAFIFFSSTPFYVYSFFTVQLNHYETDLLFRYLSQNLTWHCLLVYGFLFVTIKKLFCTGMKIKTKTI